MHIHDYSRIPDHMMKNIKGYVEGKEYLGGFLTAVFANDLMQAVGRADEINMELIPIYSSYIYNFLPLNCHGSYEIIENWYKKHEGNNNE